MKTWMKILMWFGLGGGIGFFAGYQVGAKVQKKEDETEQAQEWKQEQPDITVEEALDAYRGEENAEELPKADTDDEEMPEEPPRIGDEEIIEDIPQLHPQHLIPKRISEDEYYENPNGYEQARLIFYDLDEVVYNPETRSKVKNPEEIVGLATLKGLDKNHPLIFVSNSTIETVFRIEWLDAAYEDEILGANAPEYAEDEEEDFTEEDIE